MSTLDHLAIVYETEGACLDRLMAHGFAPAIAREVAVYLAQATDLAARTGELRDALGAEGIAVTFLELDAAAEALPRLDPARSIVWCQTDGFRYYRGSAVPALARLLGLARFGSPPHVQHICQDKLASLAMAEAAGVPIPPTRLVEAGDTVAALRDSGADWARAELFVKPATLGAKIGIFADSRCTGEAEATVLARRIWDRYGDRAVVQPFVEGDDVRVSFLDTGGDLAARLGIARLRRDPASETGGAFMTMRDNETLSGARDTSGTRGAFGDTHAAAFTPGMDDLRAGSDPQARTASAAILAHATRLGRLLPLQDYFSMDFRIDAEGQPTFFEFETCPAVTIYDFQHYLATMHGLELGPALARALRLAFARHSSAGRSVAGGRGGHLGGDDQLADQGPGRPGSESPKLMTSVGQSCAQVAAVDRADRRVVDQGDRDRGVLDPFGDEDPAGQGPTGRRGSASTKRLGVADLDVDLGGGRGGGPGGDSVGLHQAVRCSGYLTRPW